MTSCRPYTGAGDEKFIVSLHPHNRIVIPLWYIDTGFSDEADFLP